MELNKIVSLISKRFDKYKRKKVEREKIMKEMQKEFKDMSATMQSFNVSLDRAEAIFQEKLVVNIWAL